MQKNSLKMVKFFVMFVIFIAILLVVAKTQMAYVKKQAAKEVTPQEIEELLKKQKEQMQAENQKESGNQEEATSQKTDYQKIYEDAVASMNNKDYESAINGFETCINNPDEQKSEMALKYLAYTTYDAKIYDKAKLYLNRILDNQNLSNEEKKKYESMLADSCFNTEAYEEALGIYEKKYNESRTLVDFKNMANVLIKLNQKEKLNTYYTNHIKLYSFDKQDLQPYKKYLDENKEN